ncbi:capsular polysaccharide biosynthesis protein [Marinibacterium profundimaris]|uniref:capsular polysaccharide biosynthesis protein n=1 Tax=Marinibacterium profundimaris TaxID=1679460 RepID=UPI001E469909|nr:capsular polysaccharide biosynthesis protein [Marinibacterium profundimaris]
MADGTPSRLYAYNGGFFTSRRIRRILTLSGYSLPLGLPGPDDAVVTWGASPTSHRGRAVADRRGVPVVTVEDAWLRSLFPGRSGEPPLGLLIDHAGVHFDPAQPSDLETLLASHPLDDTALLNRARDAITRIQNAHLTKYSAVDPDEPVPPPGYVLVIDQTRGDASVNASKGDRARFLEMLFVAQEEHPGARIVIKTHPETAQGHRPGHYGPQDTNDRISLYTRPCSPWPLLESAIAVYTLSSQMGFEAILAGHRPRVFGHPFYAGWGLTDEENPLPRRQRRLTRAQLFTAAMLLYPRWYDPYRDRLCTLEDLLATLEARARAWREDRHGWVASGMRLWKRAPLQKVFGQYRKIRFMDDPEAARRSGRPWMIWAGKSSEATQEAMYVEDGFLRSRGLGAALVPPLSLVVDDQGIYYDPTRPSRLETLIHEASCELRADQRLRTERLIATLTGAGLSKYNLAGDLPDLPPGHRILVPGQVEDDASIRLGTDRISTNLGLLSAVRAARPDAVLIYKPHPDVEAGLRPGAIEAEAIADVVLRSADPAALLGAVDEVWTMTSLLGFEALLRGVPVTTLGAPFYAGWGLTTDLGRVPVRRGVRPDLLQLTHAVLIDYPRYFDPVTGTACPPEVVVDRLAHGPLPRPGLGNRSLAKLQGAFATWAHLWR